MISRNLSRSFGLRQVKLCHCLLDGWTINGTDYQIGLFRLGQELGVLHRRHESVLKGKQAFLRQSRRHGVCDGSGTVSLSTKPQQVLSFFGLSLLG